MPGVGVVMVSSIACATFATWKRAAGIREPSHHDRHAQMRPAPLLLRAGSTRGASRLDSWCEQARLLREASASKQVRSSASPSSHRRPGRGGSASRRESPSWGGAPDDVRHSQSRDARLRHRRHARVIQRPRLRFDALAVLAAVWALAWVVPSLSALLVCGLAIAGHWVQRRSSCAVKARSPAESPASVRTSCSSSLRSAFSSGRTPWWTPTG